ncbi:hypothetical protein Q095_00353 [Pseudomonas aeruginosa PS50]|uniref:hypothetical protein n=1 Tax=Pseudomonas aeruginosa TaxID=287 RepID=UPI00044D3A38|nr:hypothetical protein [Pseudomonas aeruginosa]ETU79900.1 hypothetical protein Q095_00353 [Pseudomonas aeruginosa PS50]
MSQAYLWNGHLCGEINGDREKRFRDGARFMSSRINFGFEISGHRLFLTQSRSLYLVASWRRFDEAVEGIDFSEGISPIDLMFLADPERQPDFSNEIELANEDEVKLIKVGLPNLRSRRIIPASDETSDSPESERNAKIFKLAHDLMDPEELKTTLESARNEFMEMENTQVLIEYTARRADPFFLRLLSLGYLPEWQCVLVLDGQFNVSTKATNHAAICLLVALPTCALSDELRELKFQVDLGI